MNGSPEELGGADVAGFEQLTYIESNPNATVEEMRAYLEALERTLAEQKADFEQKSPEEQEKVRVGMERYFARMEKNVESIKQEIGRKGLN